MNLSKNIVVVTGSPRSLGNAEMLADAFIEGARSAGNIITKMNAGKMYINGCTDCQYCFSHDGACCQRDDMQEIYEAMRKADMLVFASPVYWFGFPSQLKAVIDRMYAGIGSPYPIASTALLLVYADTDTSVIDPVILHYKAIAGYLGWEIKGIVSQDGVSDKQEINGKKSLIDARDLGRNIR